MGRNSWIYFAIFLLVTVFVLALLNWAFPGALAAEGSQMNLVYSLTLLALIGSSLIAGWRGAPGLALKQAFTWIAIFLGFLVLYSYRTEFQMLGARVGLELAPSVAVSERPGEVSLRASQGGHFIASSLVNGTHVQFLVDTGATVVTLTEYDAKRVGIDTDELAYTQVFNTANGQTFAATVTLQEVRIGEVSVRDVRAAVLREGLNQSLLGMSFLRSLRSFEVDQDRLVLRQ